MPDNTKVARVFGFLVASCVLSVGLVFSAFAEKTFGSEDPTPVRTDVRIEQLEGVEYRNDFTLGPTKFSLGLNPGEETVVEIQVTSRIEQETTFEVGVEDFTSQDDPEKYTKFLGDEKGQFSAKEWFHPAVSSFTLMHGERAYLPVTITVPENAEVGDHYSVVFIKTTPEAESASGITFSSRVGTLFLLSVGDGVAVRKTGECSLFESENSIYASLPVNFALHFDNEGDVHLTPFGKITISNMFGNTVDEILVPDWVVLRESSRIQTVTWEPTYAFGKYTATAQIERGYDNVVDVRTVTFYVIPVKFVVIALGAVVVVVVLYKVFISGFEIKRRTHAVESKVS